MKIAVPYHDGEIFQHFGHTEQFKIYEILDKKLVSEQLVDATGSGHTALAGFLSSCSVDVVICGGIGDGAQTALQRAGIGVYGGVSGNADDAIRSLLEGSFTYNPNAHCDEEDGECECGECGENTCGECGDEGCGDCKYLCWD